MKRSPASPVLKSFLCGLVLSAAQVGAQTIEIGNVDPTPYSTTLGSYALTINGVEDTTLTFPAYNVTVIGGSNGGEVLIGQNFLAICVNISYPGLSPSPDFSLSLDGSSLSYDLDGAGSLPDSWNVDTEAKYNAVRDIVAVFGAQLAGMDQSLPDFQNRITALNFAFAEISADGVSTSTDALTQGLMQIRNSDDSPLSDPILAYYSAYMSAIGTVPNNDLVLYAAGIDGVLNQDVILIPVPEPGAAMLAGAAGLLGLVRRRRRCA